jgi:response regulator RpfG family c-di-GMP phosphodiesterase
MGEFLEKGKPMEASSKEKQPHHLLIVEDDVDTLELLCDLFVGLDYKVKTAEDGASALEQTAGSEVDLILSDYRLPDITGTELLEKLQTTHPDAIRIIITGYTEVNVAMDAINRGKVYKFITKPLNFDELVVIVKRALEHKDALMEQKRLEKEIVQYSRFLEKQVNTRTSDLLSANAELALKNRELERQKKEIDQLYREIQRNYLGTITSLCSAIEAKDKYTRGHSDRVFYYALKMAKDLRLSKRNVEQLRYASFLHDLGKIGIPDSILMKPGKLTPDEYALVKEHPKVGERILNPIRFLKDTKSIIRHHHERVDGNGYPDGLDFESITIEERVIAVADAYDSMRSERPYRGPMSKKEALDVLNEEKGKQFCPKVVDVFVQIIERDGDLQDNEEELKKHVQSREEEEAKLSGGERPFTPVEETDDEPLEKVADQVNTEE